jgi:TonB family protein
MIAMNRTFAALAALLSICAPTFAQAPQLAVMNAEAAVYPPMALAARVYGDVVLNVTLTSDGHVGAVTVQSGPPMLRQAAIDSAKRSQYQSNPQNRAGVYQLVYRFVLEQTTKCEHDPSYPRVKHEDNVVTITEQNVPICDPAAVVERVRFRSAKCFYLWKCGSKAQ